MIEKDKKTETTTEKKKEEIKVIAGRFDFAIPVKDLKALKKNPRSRVRRLYANMFIDTILSIDIDKIVNKD